MSDRGFWRYVSKQIGLGRRGHDAVASVGPSMCQSCLAAIILPLEVTSNRHDSI